MTRPKAATLQEKDTRDGHKPMPPTFQQDLYCLTMEKTIF